MIKTNKGYFVVCVEKDNIVKYIKSYNYRNMPYYNGTSKLYTNKYKTYVYLTANINEAKTWKLERGASRMTEAVFKKHYGNEYNLNVKNITKRVVRKEKLDEIGIK